MDQIINYFSIILFIPGNSAFQVALNSELCNWKILWEIIKGLIVLYREHITDYLYEKRKAGMRSSCKLPHSPLCLFLRHLCYYQKLPDTSNHFIHVHNDFQTVILIIFFFSHGNNTAFTYIYIQRLKVPGIIIFFTYKISKTASLFPYPDCITQTPEIACIHTNNYISLHI